jgi:esterase/lipase superfamily enzyme
MDAKEYLASKGLNDHDYMDSGMIDHISEQMEEYHAAKIRSDISCVSCKFFPEKYDDYCDKCWNHNKYERVL